MSISKRLFISFLLPPDRFVRRERKISDTKERECEWLEGVKPARANVVPPCHLLLLINWSLIFMHGAMQS
jgi:hypothetical protein